MSRRRAEHVPTAAATRLLEARQKAHDDLLSRLIAFVRNVLNLLGIDGVDHGEAVAMIVDAVAVGREQAADLTRAYVDTVFALGEHGTTTLPDADRDVLAREWSDLVDRYLAERTDELVAEIGQVLEDEISGAADSAAETPSAVGYRRVIHPERSDTGVCGLCVAAAHKVYSKPNLRKIHRRCKCTVLPVMEARDLGKEINDADLAAAYAAANTKDGWTLKQVRFKGSAGGDLSAVQERKAKGARVPRGEDSKRGSRGSAGYAAVKDPEKGARTTRMEIARLEAMPDLPAHEVERLARLRKRLRRYEAAMKSGR